LFLLINHVPYVYKCLEDEQNEDKLSNSNDYPTQNNEVQPLVEYSPQSHYYQQRLSFSNEHQKFDYNITKDFCTVDYSQPSHQEKSKTDYKFKLADRMPMQSIDNDNQNYFHSEDTQKAKFKENFKNTMPSHFEKSSTKQFSIKNPIILQMGPGEHQIKDYNFQPVNILYVNYTAQSSDYISVKLICDPKMNRVDPEVFILAFSPAFAVDESNLVFLPNLKISKEMLKGRTKGFNFYLEYSLIVKGNEVHSVRSNPFRLWSNVNQTGFPREKREEYVTQTETINKKRKRN